MRKQLGPANIINPDLLPPYLKSTMHGGSDHQSILAIKTLKAKRLQVLIHGISPRLDILVNNYELRV